MPQTKKRKSPPQESIHEEKSNKSQKTGNSKGIDRNQGTKCNICNKVIIDQSASHNGEDAIYCEGKCSSWLHRHCAGLSVSQFVHMSSASEPFYCVYCTLQKQAQEIDELKQTVKSLTSDITALKAQIPVTMSDNNLSKKPTANLSQKSTAGKSKASTSLIPTSMINNNSPVFNADRKLNLVLYGLKENPEKTPKHERLQKDLDNILSVFASINVKVEANSIKDCYRLGKFIPSRSKPRPILVKFLRSLDTLLILTNKKLLSPPIYIKPDMTPEEKAKESILLKERKALIEQGYERKSIRMYKNCLYLNDRLYGQCNESGFHRTDAPPPDQTASSSSPTLLNQSSTSEANPASMDTSKDQN